MRNNKFRIVEDSKYGYKRLEPLPEAKQLSEFYESKYYGLIRKGGRAPELRRLMAGGIKARHEREWLRSTLYVDICDTLTKHSVGKKVLDVGCGTGEFVSYLRDKKFDAIGIEPSCDAVVGTKSQDLKVYNYTIEAFSDEHKERRMATFDAIVLLNVLEHVPDPIRVIKIAKTLLRSKGIICIRVPNDFTEMQSAAQKKINKDPWWIAAPDHINYFNFKNLHALLEKLGFKVIYSQGDFPMELFLLMGEDYVGNPAIGNICHQKRVQFEMALPADARRTMYRELAKIGIGRDCLVFGQLKKIE